MKNARRSGFQGILCGILSAILACLILTPELAFGTNDKGNNAVYNSSGPTGSAAFIDASAYADPLNKKDICATLYGIISATGYPLTGAVVDARGINATNAVTDSSGKNLTCAESPWVFNGISTSNPATILLPAPNINQTPTTTNTIVISETWMLPNGSRLIGELPSPQGMTDPAGDGNPTLRAASGFPAGSPMIQMGTSSCPSNGCTGVTVEHVTLDANDQDIDGIDNPYSQEGSYVDDVSIKNVGRTGLKISAGNSGPYTNINYSSYTCGTTQCPACIELLVPTKGVQGATCIGDASVAQPNSGKAAIYVKASNNSIKDIHIEAFSDGVQVVGGKSHFACE